MWEKTGVNLHDIGSHNLVRYDIKSLKKKKRNLNYIKIKTFLLKRASSKGETNNPQSGRKYLQIIYLTYNKQVSGVCEELLTFNNTKGISIEK